MDAIAMETLMSAADDLRDWRQANSLSLLALANKLDTNPSTVHRWETGETVPGSMALKKLIERITKGAVRAKDWGR